MIYLATIVTVHDPYNFTTTRYHLEERLVTKEDDQEVKKIKILCLIKRYERKLLNF